MVEEVCHYAGTRFRLSSNDIKLILIMMMLFDHSVLVLCPNDYSLRLFATFVSRSVAPGMIYFLLEGFIHTRNRQKYLIRLFLFAILSQFAFSFAFGTPLIPNRYELLHQYVNMIWGLFWGLATLYVLFSSTKTVKKWMKILFWIFAAIMALPADFMFIAVAVLPIMYYFREDRCIKIAILMIGSVAINSCCAFYWTGSLVNILIASVGCLLLIPILFFYTGERGRFKSMKWFFYVFYPLHLVILGILRSMLMI